MLQQSPVLTTIQNIKLIFATSVTVHLYDSMMDTLAAWVAWYDIRANMASSAWQSDQKANMKISECLSDLTHLLFLHKFIATKLEHKTIPFFCIY